MFSNLGGHPSISALFNRHAAPAASFNPSVQRTRLRASLTSWTLGREMKLSQTDEQSLGALGAEASEMLLRRDYSGLAHRFGYIFSQGREPAVVIEADFLNAVASPHKSDGRQSIAIKYFEPNSAGLFALVECLVPVANDAAVLMELIVTGQDEKHIMIEEISGVLE